MTRFLYFTAVVFAMACGCKPTGESKKISPSESKKDLAAQKADFTLTAVEFAKEFETAKDAADTKYKDKIVELDGEASNPTDRRFDATVIVGQYKSDPNKILGCMVVAAFPNGERPKALALTKGQKVKLKGKFAASLASTVSLVDCVLLDQGPDPTINVTAADLTKAFATDEKAATAKYGDKMVAVEGTFIEMKKSGVVNVAIVEGFDEKSATPVRISAGIPTDQVDNFTTLKKGNKVKFKGELSGYYSDGPGHIVNINGAKIVK